MSVREVDAVVVGSGQGGNPLAQALAAAGRRTVVVEREHVGGTCINEGCTPTKTMVASARVAHLARRAADYGVRTGPVDVDMEVVRRRKRDMVTSWREGGERRLEQADGLELLRGEARFVGPRRLVVTGDDGTGTTLAAPVVVLNTGARPAAPPVEGLADVPTLDSTSIMELGEVPDHLLVLGGGYIGVELAQMFRRFGARVTVVQRGDHLLAREDDDVADALADVLRAEGVEVLLGHDAVRAGGDGDGVTLTVSTGGGAERTLTGSHLLVAVGRAPNTEALDLPAAGVQTHRRGHVLVDETLATTAEGVWAIGDVTGGPAFTHVSYDDFRVLRQTLLGGGDRDDGRAGAAYYTVFTDPQLGRVGLSESSAREQGLDVLVAAMPLSSVARAIEVDEQQGLVKAVVDAQTKRLLGATVLGVEGGEICALLQVAMMGGVPYPVLRDGVFSHPTFSELLNTLFADLP